ncbi:MULTISPECIES: hypothetical protein [unclassified Streptomyces]|uniref:hypothetical protein n=1 Tax=unclassified Streptomyces TaxID=2593676 RepID=UPI0030773A26
MSAARPGRTHDNTAAHDDHILAHLRAAGLGALADLGFRGLDNDILDPVILTGHAASHTHTLSPGLRSPQELADTRQTPCRSRPCHPTLARIARPDEPRSQPLTDDLLRELTPTTSVSTPRTGHTSLLNCFFWLAKAQAGPPRRHHRTRRRPARGLLHLRRGPGPAPDHPRRHQRCRSAMDKTASSG